MNNNFVKDNLLPDEQILATAKWHWMKNWALTILLFLVYLAFFIGFINKSYSEKQWFISDSDSYEDKEFWRSYPTWLMFVEDYGASFAVSLVLVSCSFFITKKLTKYDEFAITNLRVVAKVGVIRRIAFELHNEQVESIGIYQGILGRIFGYGTLIPGGVGASKVRIRFVKDPFELRQHFYDLKKGQQVTQN